MLRVILLTATCLAIPATAEAFHFTSQFADHPFLRIYGGGGIYYTGSPRSNGMDCRHCHIGSERFPNRTTLMVTTQLVSGGNLSAYDLFNQGYEPGARYKITVTFVGEHRGKCTSNRTYEDPNGTAYKLSCPGDQCNGGLGFPVNRDHFTAEVVNEAFVYASFNGGAAGTLRPDLEGSATGTGQCRVGSNGCNSGQISDNPTPAHQGGPTTTMFMNWRLVDPNDASNGSFGRWSCVTDCDAIVSNNGIYPWTDTATNPLQRSFSFFWQAPSAAPAAGNGRIRFYMAAVDGDGFFDAKDDDVVTVKVAVCPAGSGTCDPNVGPGWGLGN